MIVNFYFHTDKIPQPYKWCVDSWRTFHDVKIWGPAELGINSALPPNFQKDIASWKVLYETGGIFSDTDVECLKSFDPLTDSVGSFCFATGFEVARANCLIYSEKGNPLMKTLLDETVVMVAKKYSVLDLCKRHSELLSRCDVVYPREYMPIEIHGNLSCKRDKAYAIHRHFMGWRK